MSWLRNHMRHFVIPGIRTIARAEGKPLTDQDIKPCDKILRPSTKCEYVEAGMLMALVSSILPKSSVTREVSIALCRTLGKKTDADAVYQLDLGGRGVDNRVKKLAEGYDGVQGADVLHSFITNSVKELKRRTKKRRVAIYPGRDVWCWQVMSQRQGMPSLYDSRVSRSVAGNQKAVKELIKPWRIPDWEKTVLFDTGHAGTVPRAIGKAAGLDKMMVIMLSAMNNQEQIFRTHAKSRRKALACEYLAKYRQRATVRDDAPYQELAHLEEFIKAALLTIWLWYHVSPARLPAWRDEPEPKKDKPQFTIAPSGSLSVQPTPVLTINSPSWHQSPIWVNTTSGSATNTGIIDWNTSATSTTGGNWDLVTGATTLNDLWGQNVGTQMLADQIADQRKEIAYLKKKYEESLKSPPKDITPAINPQTFQLIDPASKAPLEPAMDAKAQGLDPVQYELQRARKEALEKAQNELLKKQHDPSRLNKSLYTTVGINGPPYGPPSVQRRIDLDKQTGQVVKNTIISQPLPGGLQPKSPSQPIQSPGGPGGGSAPTPTTGKLRVVPIPPLPVTDGKGNPITT